MKKPQDLLPKKLKFKKFAKHSSRGDVMALSLPQNPYAPTYVNAALARGLNTAGVTRVNIMTDPENEAIALEATKKSEGFALVQTGERGFSLSAKLRTVMPCGRYVFAESLSSKGCMVFKKEYTTFKKEAAHGQN